VLLPPNFAPNNGCWLKNTTDGPYANKGVTACQVSSPPPPAPTPPNPPTPPPKSCQFVADTDYGSTDDIILTTQSLTAEACCADCQANPKCAVGVLLPESFGSNKGCWLKTTTEGPYTNKGVTACVSGRPPAPAPEHAPLKLLTDTAARCMDGSQVGQWPAPARRAGRRHAARSAGRSVSRRAKRIVAACHSVAFCLASCRITSY
jgi:hypothetical protein